MRKPDAHRAANPDEFDERWIVGRNDMAAILGVSPSALSKLSAKGMPKPRDGAYSIPHAVQFYLDLWRQPSAHDDSGETLDLRSRLTLAQARKYELDAEIMRSHYVALDVVERIVTEATASLAASLDGLGARLAGVLADETEPAQVQALITTAAREVREQYATILQGWADESMAADASEDVDGGGVGDAPASGKNGRPMG